ncbi:MAG: molecular chaperone DnaJ [Patescibacteria group bacterium]|nr:molecular chaperone DnaJ [Patescibacteria group bacterium]
MSDYYSILGVNKTASQEEVKRAYRKLAHQYHPDKKGGNEQRFKEINEAYQVLGNEEKRKQYDQFGRTFDNQTGQGQGGFDFNSFWQSGGKNNEGFDFGLGDIFADFFGGGRSASSGKKETRRGSDIEISVEINLADVLTGVEKNIILTKMVMCSRCEGRGAEPGSNLKECFTCRGVGQVQQVRQTMFGSMSRFVTCPECKGEGRIPEKPCNVCRGEGRLKGEEEIKIHIPEGVDSGQTLRVDGKGGAGKRGGKPGNLYIQIVVKKHPLFQRKGDNLFTFSPIAFSQAVLGGEVELKTLDNKTISLKIPAGAESGKILKISGKGVPNFTGWGKGDLFVELIVQTPKKLTKKQKELLEELKKEGL